MTVFTNVAPSIVYGDLLSCTNNGQGLSPVQTNLQDALGNNSPILIATTSVNFSRGLGELQIDGVEITAEPDSINSMCVPNPTALGNSFFSLPAGDTAQRPVAPNLGDIRFNTDINRVESFVGAGTWLNISGGSVTSVTGTVGQINVANPTTTPVLSLASNLQNINSISPLGPFLTLNGTGPTNIQISGGFFTVNALFQVNNGSIQIASGFELKLSNTSDTFIASFRASPAATQNTFYTFPTQFPTVNDQALTSNVVGTMSWTSFQKINIFNQNASITLINNSRNIINAGGNINLLLPTLSSVGDVIIIVGNTGAWTITQLPGQTIHFGNLNTTTGLAGSLSSTAARNCVELVCVAANTDFVVSNHEGNLNVV